MIEDADVSSNGVEKYVTYVFRVLDQKTQKNEKEIHTLSSVVRSTWT